MKTMHALLLTGVFLLFICTSSCSQEDKPAQIAWDTWGAPHITANSTEAIDNSDIYEITLDEDGYLLDDLFTAVDQLELFSKKELRKAWFTPEQVKKTHRQDRGLHAKRGGGIPAQTVIKSVAGNLTNPVRQLQNRFVYFLNIIE